MEFEVISPHPLVDNIKGELLRMEKQVKEIIKDPNFDGLYFTDGYQGEILVNAMHKKIIGKKLTGYFAMKPDLSNMDQVINNVVSAWKQQATERGIRDFNNFLKLMYVEGVK